MFAELLSSVAGPLLGGLFGKKSQSPVPATDASMSPSQVPRASSPVPPAPPPKGLADKMRSAGQDVFGGMLDDADRAARSATVGRLQAKVDGKNRQEYLDAAFPGTTSWEQLGSGAGSSGSDYGQMAAQSEELAQRERESKRNSHVQLSAARVQAAQSLAGGLIANGNYEAAERMIKAAGIFDPSLGVDSKMMAGGRVASEMRRIDQETYRSQEMLPYERAASASRSRSDDASAMSSYAQADLTRVREGLAPYEFALKEFAETSGNSRIAEELRGGYHKLVKPISEWSTGYELPGDNASFSRFLVDFLADRYGSEYADKFQRVLKSRSMQ